MVVHRVVADALAKVEIRPAEVMRRWKAWKQWVPRGGRKCVPLKILHGGQDVGEGEVRQRVVRGDLEGLGEDVGRVVGAVHAVQDVGQGQEPVVPVVTSTKLHGFRL